MNTLIRKILVPLLLTLVAAASAQAAVVTYNYTISGTVLTGEELFTPNTWGLSAGDVIVATGTFTADLSVGGDVAVSLGSGSGNSLSIDMLDGSFLNASDDQNFGSGYPQLVFNSGSLTEFNMIVASPNFNSNFLFFDDGDGLLGQWSLTQLTPVPVPAAAWLFGSALIGLGGMVRRRRA